ncbi:MAG: hypothetical protein Q4E64_08090 [Phascolarctobacterium sp.]|uniref:hypothetical protein n=1 Tax=Phascolarctobacterium sp. TaxID=2049039 RepID=UPI0026DB9967|nr:hypothetical protein [Phascolarctobacterium sp.]MDO4921769.1 hypothetical protein [Phascolarctobacterium sp.]
MEEKIKRNQIDDIYRRNNAKDSYKNRAFAGKRSTWDEYTRERIFYDSKFHVNQKQSNIDHIIPIDELRRRYGEELSIEQLREIANADANLANTNAALNKAKGGKSNIDYLWDKYTEDAKCTLNNLSDKKRFDVKEARVDSPDLTTSANMISKQVSAEINVRAKAAQYKLQNMLDKGKQKTEQLVSNVKSFDNTVKAMSPMAGKAIAKGQDAAFVTATVSGLTNLMEVARGKQDIKTAAINVGKDTVKGFGTGAGLSIVQDSMVIAAQKYGAKNLAKTLSKNLPVMQIAVAAEIGGIVYRYLDGDISGEECTAEIIVGTAGCWASAMAWAVAGPVGAIVASIIVGEIGKAVARYQMERKADRKRVAQFNHITNEALRCLQEQKERVVNYNRREKARLEKSFSDGMEQLHAGIMSSQEKEVIYGLNRILAVFNEECYFQSLQEFDEIFFDDQSVLSL